MKQFTLTKLGAILVGHNVGDKITKSDLFDKDPICCSDECGFTIDREILPKLTIRAHVFLKPEHYSEVDNGLYYNSYGDVVGNLEFVKEALSHKLDGEPVFSSLIENGPFAKPFKTVTVGDLQSRAYLINENPEGKHIKYGLDPLFFGNALHICVGEYLDLTKTSKVQKVEMVNENMIVETKNSIYVTKFSNKEVRDMSISSMRERGYLYPKSQQRKDL